MAPLLSTQTQVELYEIRDGKHILTAKGPLEVSPLETAPRFYPTLPLPFLGGGNANNANPTPNTPTTTAAAAILTVNTTHPHPPLELRPTTHAMRSLTDAGEDSFILGQVLPGGDAHFWAVVFPRGGSTPKSEAEALCHLLQRLTKYSLSPRAEKEAKRRAAAPPIPAPLKQLDPTRLPQLDVKALNEVLRKGAEDTRMVLAGAGAAVAGGFAAAAEMHKRYAPAPSAQPAKVPEAVAQNLAHAKQAAMAGSAMAKGVSSGMQAATTELGGAVAGAATAAAGGGGKNGGNSAVAKDVGSVGVELLRDAASVRDALLAAVGQAFGGARDAVVDVMSHQYGQEMGKAAADALDTAGGAGQMAVAGAMCAPTQVAMSAAQRQAEKEEAARALEAQRKSGGVGGAASSSSSGAELERARAELERERAALAAERARLQQQQPQQKKRGGGGPLGFLFGGA